MLILGIDPGPVFSGYALVADNLHPVTAGKIFNDCLLFRMGSINSSMPDAIAIEIIQPMGMPVGAEVFETCEMVGRITETARMHGIPMYRYKRHDYARFFIGKTRKVTDALLYAALRKFFRWIPGGEPKMLKGPSDKRSAFAVAAYHILLKEQ